MDYRKLLTCILVISQLAGLAACSSANTAPSASTAADGSVQEPAGGDLARLEGEPNRETETAGLETVLLTGYAGAAAYTATEDGFYQAVPNPNGGCNILYTDFSSAATIYLCSQPNCTHDGDTCASWFPSDAIELFSVSGGNALYCIENGGQGGRLWKMDLAGNNRQRLYQCGPAESIRDAVAGNESALYFSVMTRSSSDGLPQKALLQVDASNGQTETLLEYPAQTWLFGAYGHTLLLLRYDEPSFVYQAYDLQTQTLCDLYDYDVDGTGAGPIARPCGNELYIFEPSGELEASIVKMNLETGERETLAEGFPYFGAEAAAISGFYDGYMSVFITDPSSREQKHYLIDCQTGTPYPICLEYQQGAISVPVDIYAETDSDFIVNCGIRPQEVVLQNTDGTFYTSQVDCMQYGLIPKTDYLNNVYKPLVIDLPLSEARPQQ